MKYTEMREQMIWNLRLDFDPVGIRYIYKEEEIKDLPVTHRAKAKITFCQYLAAARQQRSALFMGPERLACENASPVFGFRDLARPVDAQLQMKYLHDEEVCWRACEDKPQLDKGCMGIYMAPLDYFDRTEHRPHVVYFVVTPWQGYHLLSDYMGGTKKPSLQFLHTPSSAVCGGSVYAYMQQTANMNTMCAGSKTSGKTEMNYMNLFVPGAHINALAEHQKMRIEKGQGASLVGQGSQPWPGLDACKGCPMFKFEEV